VARIWTLFVLGSLGLVMAAAAVTTETSWVDEATYDAFHVVVGENAGDTERLAASEFVRLWQCTTGFSPSMSHAPSGAVNVYIGRSSIPGALLTAFDVTSLGKNGIVIKTYSDCNPTSHELHLLGKSERCALYAVYDFFERYMGIRWLTPAFTHIPEEPPAFIPAIDRRYSPPFEWHDCTYLHTYFDEGTNAVRDFRRVHKYEDGFIHGPFGGHSLYSLLPPEIWFKEHPEYYAEVDGERVAPSDHVVRGLGELVEGDKIGQLCSSNPEVAEIIGNTINKLIEWDDPDFINAPVTPSNTWVRNIVGWHPSKKIWSVCQMDWPGTCECEECAAIDKREGTPMGSLLTMVNRVADIVGEKHPKHFIQTLAYGYSVPAPKHLKPRDNVIIQFNTITANFAVPLDDESSEHNRPIAKNLTKWSRICNNLHVYHHVPNYASCLRMNPNLHTLQPNLQLFARHNVWSVYEQAAELAPLPPIGLAPLRNYMIAKLAWDPNCDIDKHKDDFLRLYYGKAAAPFIREYIEMLEHKVVEEKVFQPWFAEPYWVDYDLITKAQELFRKAREAADSDLERLHIAMAYAQVEYAALVYCPKLQRKGSKLFAPRPPAPPLGEYIEKLKSFGLKDYKGCLDTPMENLQKRLEATAIPARCEEVPLEVLENDHVALWVVPEWQGAVLRWRVKDHDIELLRGYEHYGALPVIWREYTHTPPIGQPIAETFRVVEHASDSIVLEAEMENGLMVRKRIAIAPESNQVDFTLTVHNGTGEPMVPLVKSVPEFYTQGPVHPEIWTQVSGEWARQNAEAEPSRLEILDEAEYMALAARFPKAKLTLVSTFTPGEMQPLLWAYRSEDPFNQLNLDVLPNQAPLEPGETRSATVSYYVTKKKPKRIR